MTVQLRFVPSYDDGVLLLDVDKMKVICLLQHSKAPSWDTVSQLWLNTPLDKADMSFLRPAGPCDRVFEFKGKTYVKLLEPNEDGFLDIRCLDNFYKQDPVFKTGEEDESDS